MRIIKPFLPFSILLLVVGCRGCFRGVSDAVLPTGGNPELISYLQGTWVRADNDKSGIRIKRDSIIEVSDDSARNTRNLSYEFAGTAESYFTKDSSFDFSAGGGRSLATDEFKLIENGQSPADTVTHLLSFVSKSRLVMNTHGRFEEFKRVK